MGFSPDNYTVDVALEDDFQAWLRQLPAAVQEPARTVADDDQRHFRQALWTLFSQVGGVSDTETLSGIVEVVALASSLIPVTFKPQTMSLSDIAMSKTEAYGSQYLYGHFVATLAESDLPQSEITTLLQTAQQFWLANGTRLQLNFNQRERVADYLKDAKARSGALSAMNCRLASVTAGITDKAVTDLISTIGETLGVIAQILTDVNTTHDSLDFRTLILSGNYPLSLLFAFEEESDWFQNFFGSAKKPTDDQFDIARKLTIQAGEEPALQLAKELISQTQIDAKTLPSGTVQERLQQLLVQLENDAADYLKS